MPVSYKQQTWKNGHNFSQLHPVQLFALISPMESFHFSFQYLPVKTFLNKHLLPWKRFCFVQVSLMPCVKEAIHPSALHYSSETSTTEVELCHDKILLFYLKKKEVFKSFGVYLMKSSGVEENSHQDSSPHCSCATSAIISSLWKVTFHKNH